MVLVESVPIARVMPREPEEKQNLLARYLNNVNDLVEDLKESTPFGGVLS